MLSCIEDTNTQWIPTASIEPRTGNIQGTVDILLPHHAIDDGRSLSEDTMVNAAQHPVD